MIVIQNWDKPGIIGNLGTLLGKHNINIAAMTFGREKPGGRAISVLNVDSPVSPEILNKIKKTENILEVKVIRL
jgi:D-3-phosphoglycerate dehydrogenase